MSRSAVSLPRRGEVCGACGGRLAVDRAGVVSCRGGCEVPRYGEAVGLQARPGHVELRCGRCGFAGLPTFWRGVALLECPRCEGASEPVPPAPAGKHWVIRLGRARVRLARNAPCSCGSGLKVKKCHPEWC